MKGALVWAVDACPAAVPALIEGGADINLRTPMGTPIRVAANKGDLETVGLLLDAGADPDAGGGFSTALTEAITANNLELVELLLGYGGASPEATGEHLDTAPLTLACALGQKSVVESLLALGAKIDRACQRVVGKLGDSPFGEEGSTALMMAAKHDHPEVVSVLLRAGADPNLRDGEGRTALDLATPAVTATFEKEGVTLAAASEGDKLLAAAESGDLNSLSEALVAGADPNVRDQRQRHLGWTPLIWAAAKGHLEVIQALLAAGVDLELAEEGNLQALKWLASETEPKTLRKQMKMTLARPALHIALEFAQPDAALALIRAGCALNEKGGLGFTPLHLAAEGGWTEVVKALLAAGADPKIRGPHKVRALDIASQKGHKAVAEVLLSTTKMTRKQLNKALLSACEAGQVEMVLKYLKLGADPNASTKDGGAALVRAISACRLVPLQPGDSTEGSISVSFTDEGRFALMPIPEEEALAMTSALLQAGADPESEGVMDTALIAAARYRHPEVVKQLLEAGANPKRGYHGESAFSIAKLFQAKEVLAVLESAGITHQTSPKPPPMELPEENRPPYKSARPPKLVRASRGKAFQAALSEIAELCQSDPVSHDDGGYTLHIKTSVGEIDLEGLQDAYLERGCFLAYQSAVSKLWALPLKDPLKALAFVGSAGPNYDVGTGNVIDWFKGLDQPYRITKLGHDLVGGRFLGKVRAPQELAQSMYEICPDTVEQGFMSLEALAESLEAKNAAFTLWWD